MSVTIIIIIFTAIVSIQAFNRADIFEKLKHHPYTEHRNKEYYRWLTSGLIHADYIHLAINMFVLWQFGGVVERIYQSLFGDTLGMFLFVLMYFSAIVFSDLPTFRKHKDNPYYAAVGASGAVSAIVFTFILFYPWAEMSLYGIIPFRAILGGVAYLIYEQWASKNSNDNIGHDAHFAGAIYGMMFTVLLKPSVYNDFVEQIIYNSPFW
jgi:membrane associated rhomboid family serine protease